VSNSQEMLALKPEEKYYLEDPSVIWRTVLKLI
jgi:hypothetical protein